MVTESGLSVPLIAKPVCEGSSKGIRSKCLIERLEDVGPTVVSLWNDYKQGVLLEEFIAGRRSDGGCRWQQPAASAWLHARRAEAAERPVYLQSGGQA